MDCSPPGSPVHGILPGRGQEWVSMPSSRESPDPRTEPSSPALQADSLPTEPPGKLKSLHILAEIYIYIMDIR